VICFKVQYRQLPGGTEENHNRSIWISCCAVKIRTRFFPNTKQGYHHGPIAFRVWTLDGTYVIFVPKMMLLLYWLHLRSFKTTTTIKITKKK